MKIIVIGANQGGLAMAYKLGRLGFEVLVFEKKAREKVAYDWTDDINPDIFAKMGLPMPDKSCYSKKKNWCFLCPNEKVRLAVNGDSKDISIRRRPLNDYFYDLAKDYSKISYETAVDELIITGDRITGVVIGKERLSCDLVVDCSGIFSPFRTNLPKSFHIQNTPRDNEIFVTYRGIHKWKDGEPTPEHTNKVYMLHNYEMGISWCVAEPEHTVNVLIGRLKTLAPDTLNNAFEKLMNDNPILGKELVREGITTFIPVRYPISRMVANGYVLAGDSAFMTIPMLGSGVYNSIYCAKLLSEVLERKASSDIANLWNYQRAYFLDIGGSCCSVDLLKRWMLSLDGSDVDFLFESGVLDKEMISSGGDGDMPEITTSLLLKKAWQGRKRLGVLLRLSAVMKTTKLMKKITSEEIPQEFDEERVLAWQNALDGIFSDANSTKNG